MPPSSGTPSTRARWPRRHAGWRARAAVARCRSWRSPEARRPPSPRLQQGCRARIRASHRSE
eukprot:4963220-Prymnesium_polylepis.1